MTLTLATMRTFGFFAGAVTRKIQSVLEARRNRRAVLSLADCDARMLKDIGLTHAEVIGALEAPFGHDPSELLIRDSHGYRPDYPGWRVPPQDMRVRLPQGFAQGIA